jgi:hypothetical protein
MTLLLNEDRFVAALKEMAGSFVAFIEELGINAV